jgi:antitoxin (DNA-binding transcriptional repressor) of toxin-antitoxin stability system
MGARLYISKVGTGLFHVTKRLIYTGEQWPAFERTLAHKLQYGYYSYVEKATVSKLKNNLSAYLRKVRAGHAVVIYDRDAPIARLERIESSGSGSDRLALLCARGLVRPPAQPLSAAGRDSSLQSALPRTAALSAALRADRDESR